MIVSITFDKIELNMRNFIKAIYEFTTHFIAGLTKKYYFEDYVRVYPNGLAFNRLGFKRKANDSDLKNFTNHVKFYKFASQFAQNKIIADLGCGSGYGSEILKKAGASQIFGIDLSRQSISFAIEHFGEFAKFAVDNAIETSFADDAVDITISSEVLEHVKEYGMQETAIREMKRITRPEGLLILGTPNTELLSDHGFSYDEMISLLNQQFSNFCLFENALVPFGPSRELWEKRKSEKRTGRDRFGEDSTG